MLLLLLATLVVLGLFQFIWQATVATLARSFGIDVEEVSVGFGPSLGVWRRGREVWRFKLLPLGGYTRLRDLDGFEDGQENGELPPGTFQAAPLSVRLLLQFSGPATSLLLGGLLLGVAVLLDRPQLVATAEQPGQAPGLTHAEQTSSLSGQWRLAADTSGVYGTRLLTYQRLEGWGGIGAFVVTAARTGQTSLVDWVTLLGLAGVTLGLMNLMPIPPMGGYHVLATLAAASAGRRSLPERLRMGLLYAGLIVLLVLWVRVCWLDVCWLWDNWR
jgi:membrane-associated protease RseP (regulator of RpoE activity)